MIQLWAGNKSVISADIENEGQGRVSQSVYLSYHQTNSSQTCFKNDDAAAEIVVRKRPDPLYFAVDNCFLYVDAPLQNGHLFAAVPL